MSNILYIYLHTPKCAGSTITTIIEESFTEEEKIWFHYPKRFVGKNINELLIEGVNASNILKDPTKIDLPANTDNDQEAKPFFEQYINSLSKKAKDKIKIIYGHSVYYGMHELFPERNYRYITFIRHPKQIASSAYNLARTFADTLHQQGLLKYAPKNLLSAENTFKNVATHNYLLKYLASAFNEHKSTFPKEYLGARIMNYRADTSVLEKVKTGLKQFYFIGIVENPDDFLFLCNEFKYYKPIAIKNKSKNFISSYEIKKMNTDFHNKVSLDLELYEYAKKLNINFKKKNRSFKKGVRQQKTEMLSKKKLLLLSALYKASHQLKNRSSIYSKIIRVLKK